MYLICHTAGSHHCSDLHQFQRQSSAAAAAAVVTCTLQLASLMRGDVAGELLTLKTDIK